MVAITLTILSVLFGAFVVFLILKGRLQLKYSLLWLLLCLVMILVAIWPKPIFALSSALGFVNPSNFMIVVGMLLMLAILLSLTVIVSWQSGYIRMLVQEVALLKKELKQNDSERPEQ